MNPQPTKGIDPPNFIALNFNELVSASQCVVPKQVEPGSGDNENHYCTHRTIAILNGSTVEFELSKKSRPNTGTCKERDQYESQRQPNDRGPRTV